MISPTECRTFYQKNKTRENKYLVEDLHRFVELDIPQERRQVLEEIDEQLRVHGPTLKDDNVESVKRLCP